MSAVLGWSSSSNFALVELGSWFKKLEIKLELRTQLEVKPTLYTETELKPWKVWFWFLLEIERHSWRRFVSVENPKTGFEFQICIIWVVGTRQLPNMEVRASQWSYELQATTWKRFPTHSLFGFRCASVIFWFSGLTVKSINNWQIAIENRKSMEKYG